MIRPRPHRWLEPILIWTLLAVIGWSYFHDARAQGPLVDKKPSGYYGLLTDALLAGQVHLKLIPEPAFLRLADPYAGPQGTNRPHDMSFYRGKFYLYYGITPAVALMIPWHLLTGTHLTEIGVTATFCYAGFLVATLWLLRFRRRRFPSVHSSWVLLGIAVLGLGSPVYFLSNVPTFYPVPISAAFFFLMLAGLFVGRSIQVLSQLPLATRHPPLSAPLSATLWLAVASLCLGVAVGARPNYVATLPLLLIPAFLIWRKLPGERQRSATALLCLAAPIVPAALVGLGLALYNYLRFGHVTEFGIQYSLASASVREIKLMGLEYYPKNLRLYLLHPADFVRYFPFFYAGDRPFGILPHFPLAGLALLLPLTWLSPRFRRNFPWIPDLLFWLGAALANLAILCTFFGGEDRYLVDFVPAALVASCGLILICADAVDRCPAIIRRPVLGLVAGVALWTLLNGLCFAFSRRAPTPWLTAVEHASNRMVAAVENIGEATHGPLEIKLRFPTNRTGLREPLLSTGTLVGTGDILYVAYPDSSHVQFGFFHLGAGGPLSEPIPIDYAAEHIVVIHLGSLYPPRQHPLFDRWTEPQVAKTRQRLEVILDGRSVLKASVNVYVSTPDGVHLGANPIAPDVTPPRFTGQLLASHRLGAVPPELPAVWPTGPVRLTLRFPPTRGGAPEPLLSTGKNGAGDLLSLQILADGRVRFIHDCWGSPDYASEPIAVTDLAEHTVEIEMGSLYPADATGITAALRRRLMVVFDGKVVIDVARPFNPATPDSVEFGFNAIQASSAVGMFTGTVLKTERVPARPAATSSETQNGPLALTVRFPTDANGLSEPLLCTGTFGSADLIFVQYLDANHVRFGLDHWGVGATLGPVVALDYTQVHELTLSLGSLFPPAPHAAWLSRPPGSHARLSNLTEIQLDGRVVLSANVTAHAAEPDQISVGRNDIGASTAQRTFSGQIIRQGRANW